MPETPHGVPQTRTSALSPHPRKFLRRFHVRHSAGLMPGVFVERASGARCNQASVGEERGSLRMASGKSADLKTQGPGQGAKGSMLWVVSHPMHQNQEALRRRNATHPGNAASYTHTSPPLPPLQVARPLSLAKCHVLQLEIHNTDCCFRNTDTSTPLYHFFSIAFAMLFISVFIIAFFLTAAHPEPSGPFGDGAKDFCCSSSFAARLTCK